MIIGLTGTIGSGKSTVSARLNSLGALILDADIIAREVVEPNTEGLRQIEKSFGSGVIAADGSLDRKAVAAIVFADSEKRMLLNSIIHPAVLKTLEARTASELATNSNRLIVWDVPLLIEVGWTKYVDSVWLVTAPEAVRIARIIKRDGCTPAQAEARIRAQMSEEEKRAYSSEVIDNSSSIGTLYEQIDALYKQYAGAGANA